MRGSKEGSPRAPLHGAVSRHGEERNQIHFMIGFCEQEQRDSPLSPGLDFIIKQPSSSW